VGRALGYRLGGVYDDEGLLYFWLAGLLGLCRDSQRPPIPAGVRSPLTVLALDSGLE
jgi:hypothetical protein